MSGRSVMSWENRHLLPYWQAPFIWNLHRILHMQLRLMVGSWSAHCMCNISPGYGRGEGGGLVDKTQVALVGHTAWKHCLQAHKRKVCLQPT